MSFTWPKMGWKCMGHKTSSLIDKCLSSFSFYSRIDDGHCDRVYFSVTADDGFGDVYLEKQPVDWKESRLKIW